MPGFLRLHYITSYRRINNTPELNKSHHLSPESSPSTNRSDNLPIICLIKSAIRKLIDDATRLQTIPAVDHLLPTEFYDGEVTVNQLWLSYRTLYYTLVTLVLYFVPVVVMSLAYAAIVGKLWSHRRPGEGRDFDMSAQLELSVKKKVRFLCENSVYVFL
jgi:hypothetical protein